MLCCFIRCLVLSLADHEKLILAQLEEFLAAIVKYCEPYLAMDCAAKHVRHAVSLSYPSMVHRPSPDSIILVPVGVKRKYEHCDSLGAMGPPARKLAIGPPARKLAYQRRRPFIKERWSPWPPQVHEPRVTTFN